MWEALRRVSLRSDMGVRYVWVRRWEAGAWLGVVLRAVGEVAIAIVLARCLRGLDAIARLDHVGLERDGTWATVEFEEEAAGIAEDGAGLVAAPERCGGGCAVLADRLEGSFVSSCTSLISVSHGRWLSSIVFGEVSITQSIWR